MDEDLTCKLRIDNTPIPLYQSRPVVVVVGIEFIHGNLDEARRHGKVAGVINHGDGFLCACAPLLSYKNIFFKAQSKSKRKI